MAPSLTPPFSNEGHSHICSTSAFTKHHVCPTPHQPQPDTTHCRQCPAGDTTPSGSSHSGHTSPPKVSLSGQAACSWHHRPLVARRARWRRGRLMARTKQVVVALLLRRLPADNLPSRASPGRSSLLLRAGTSLTAAPTRSPSSRPLRHRYVAGHLALGGPPISSSSQMSKSVSCWPLSTHQFADALPTPHLPMGPDPDAPVAGRTQSTCLIHDTWRV